MSEPVTDPGHLVPADEWPRIQADAERLGQLREVHPQRAYGLGRSSFPSVSGFLQCKYDGGAQPAGGPKFGVLHDAETPLTAGYAASIASYFTRNTNSTSAHFMVDPAATVQMLDTSRIAWHCGNGNTRSIGVEQAGYASFTPAQWATAAGLQQMARVAALMRDIHAVHGVGLFWMTDQQLRDAWAGRIVGGWATHAQCSRVLGGSTHTDPTPNYPFGQLMDLANQEDDDMPGYSQWSDADKQALRNDVADTVWTRPAQPPAPAPEDRIWPGDRLRGTDGKTGDIYSMLKGGNTGNENNFHYTIKVLGAQIAALQATIAAFVQSPGGLTAEQITAAAQAGADKALAELVDRIKTDAGPAAGS